MTTITKNEPVKNITLVEAASNLDTQIANYTALIAELHGQIDRVAKCPVMNLKGRERLEISSYAEGLQNKVFDLEDANNDLRAAINRLYELIGQ